VEERTSAHQRRKENDMSRTRNRSVPRLLAAGAIALGLAAGSYGIASAAGGSSSSGAAAATTTVTTPQAAPPQGGPGAGQPWGGQRSDETLLTGDTAAKVEAAAKAKVSGATIVRVETDADGNAKYEAHIVQSDGTPATVYVNEQFEVVGVESR
jgi:hypothetical protein